MGTPSSRRLREPVFRAMVALPVLAFLLGVIVTEGQYFAMLHSVQSLTRQVGKASAASDSLTARQQAAIDTVNAVIDTYPLLDRGGIAVHVTEDTLDPHQHQVTVTYNARPIGLWLLAGLAQRSSVTVHRSVTVRSPRH